MPQYAGVCTVPPPLDVTAVARMIARVGALLQSEPSLEVDLNPVILIQPAKEPLHWMH